MCTKVHRQRPVQYLFLCAVKQLQKLFLSLCFMLTIITCWQVLWFLSRGGSSLWKTKFFLHHCHKTTFFQLSFMTKLKFLPCLISINKCFIPEFNATSITFTHYNPHITIVFMFPALFCQYFLRH